MKPLHEQFPHQTFDLTEVKIYKKPDGTIVACSPKTWTELPRQIMTVHTGESHELTPYLVTEWEEVPLIPATAPKKRP